MAQILKGIEWAVDQGADVINLSLGGWALELETPNPYAETIVYALARGTSIIAAIGNEGSQTTDAPGNDWFALSVGATDYRDHPAGFSGGRTHLLRKSDYLDPSMLPFMYSKPELSAPGVAIKSSVPGGDWKELNGTSMASPHVSGAIALLLSATDIRGIAVDPMRRAFLVNDLITASVEELGESGQDHRFGFGRLDALNAIGYARELGY